MKHVSVWAGGFFPGCVEEWPDGGDSLENKSTSGKQTGAAGTEHVVSPFFVPMEYSEFCKEIMNISKQQQQIYPLHTPEVIDQVNNRSRRRGEADTGRWRERRKVHPWLLKSPKLSWMLEYFFQFGNFSKWLAVLSILFLLIAWDSQFPVMFSVFLLESPLAGLGWRITH